MKKNIFFFALTIFLYACQNNLMDSAAIETVPTRSITSFLAVPNDTFTPEEAAVDFIKYSYEGNTSAFFPMIPKENRAGYYQYEKLVAAYSPQVKTQLAAIAPYINGAVCELKRDTAICAVCCNQEGRYVDTVKIVYDKEWGWGPYFPFPYKKEKYNIRNMPDLVALEYWRAVDAVNIEYAKTLVTTESQGLLDFMSVILDNASAQEIQEFKYQNADYIRWAECTVQGNTATCKVCCDKEYKDLELTLKKVNQKWLGVLVFE